MPHRLGQPGGAVTEKGVLPAGESLRRVEPEIAEIPLRAFENGLTGGPATRAVHQGTDEADICLAVPGLLAQIGETDDFADTNTSFGMTAETDRSLLGVPLVPAM